MAEIRSTLDMVLERAARMAAEAGDIQNNDEKIQEGMKTLLSGRTAFIIAHRFSTLKEAHTIVFMEGGEISAVGTHEELMSSSDGYRSLYTKQWAESE